MFWSFSKKFKENVLITLCVFQFRPNIRHFYGWCLVLSFCNLASQFNTRFFHADFLRKKNFSFIILSSSSKNSEKKLLIYYCE